MHVCGSGLEENRGQRNGCGRWRGQQGAAEALVAPEGFAAACAEQALPPVGERLIVVTGLPRSGTSLLMQMLAAGGLGVLSDGLRESDEDNPLGYLEYEPVKNLLRDRGSRLRRRRGDQSGDRQ